MTYAGTGVAIVTPFTTNGNIDFYALEKLIEHLIAGGVDFIVSLGTTGETTTLSQKEKQEIVAHTSKIVNGRLPIMVGCGGNDTKKLIEQMQIMQTWAKFDCFLSVSPYYNKPSQEGIYQHYKAIAESTDKQIFIYNVPGRTSRNVDYATILRLASEFDNIIGLKEAGNNMHQSIEMAIKKPKDFTLLSGDDDLVLAQMAQGFDGVITVVGNAYPKEWSQMINSAKEGNIIKARAIFNRLYEFVNLIFEENNPAGVKCALNELQLCENEFRLPVCAVSENLDARLREFVREFS